MKRDVKVLLIDGEISFSQIYRVFHTEEQLRLYGIECNILKVSEIYLACQNGRTRRMLANVIKTYDILIFHRVGYDVIIDWLIQQAQEQGKITIFETDDLVFVPGMTGWIAALSDFSETEVEQYEEGVERYARTFQRCKYFLASTGFLAEIAERMGKRSFVVRNALGQDFIDRAEEACSMRQNDQSRLVIGYGSGTKTHDKDFLEAANALLHIMEKYDYVILQIVGDLSLDSRFYRYRERIRRIPQVNWDQWPFFLSSFDINIAPLERGNPFCRAKSELKYFEAGILGIPTVASKIDAFEYAIIHGKNGFLATATDEWIEALELLITSEEVKKGWRSSKSRRDCEIHS